MRRLPTAEETAYFFPRVRLFYDDLEEIIGQMNATGLIVTIRSDNYAFDSLDDLRANRGDRPRRMVLDGRLPERSDRESARLKIEFDIDEFGAHLWWDDNDQQSIEILGMQLREELRQTRFDVLARLAALLMALWLATAVLFGTDVSWNGAKASLPFGVAALTVLVMLGAVRLAESRMRGIHLRRRHEGGWWKRNADRAIFAAIGAIAGAAGCALVTHYVGK